MREIEASLISQTVARLCQEANFELPEDVLSALKQAQQSEESPLGREVLGQLIENAQIAKHERIPLCQDCGTAVVFLEVGQDIHITGGDLSVAVKEGVHRGYSEGYMRRHVEYESFTKDNTVPVIHTEIVPGDRIRIDVMPKGGGGEGVSKLTRIKPGNYKQDIIDFAAKLIDEVGSKACPPLIVGLGIGGTAEKPMLMAKKALLRRVGKPNPNPELAGLEKQVLERINALGIGPLGLGGRTTALAVHIELFATHILNLPVAINIQCNSARHREAIL